MAVAERVSIPIQGRIMRSNRSILGILALLLAGSFMLVATDSASSWAAPVANNNPEKITAAAVPSKAASVSSHDPQPNATSHRIILDGSMTLRDDESWPWDDEHAVYSIRGSAILTHGSPRRSISITRCVGGEVRGRLYVDLQLAGERILVSPTLYLYEGTSCSTTDLDGSRRGTPTWLAAGRLLRWTNLIARNTAEGVPDDYASASFTITHSI